jgi:diguanylate cyclase (GGDEF)-like protein/PAS domain S-box-containing protein
MVRTYIVTENPIYKSHYQEILDIRNGLKPRPTNNQNIYWDLVGLDNKRPRPYSNQTIPLIEIMRQAGFTSVELDKLTQAKNNSDTLTQTEFAAMKLIESQDSNIQMHRQKQKALELLHDETYHNAKTSIMRPIDEFYHLMTVRTDNAVAKAEMIAFYFRILFIVMVGYLVYTLWRILIADKARQKIEDALQKSQKHLSTIIENEPECVKLVDARGKLLEMNPAGLAMLEAHSLEEAQQYTLVEYLLPQWRADFIDLHKRVMNGESGILEFEIEGLNGTRRWLETHATPLHDNDGKVTMLLGITRDTTQRKNNENKIRYLANFDSLTGLPNRTQLDLQIKHLLSLAKRNQQEISIMFLDLDRFKEINDTLGHSIGDRLLIQSAARLQSLLREEDMVARLGGDEFIILLPNIPMNGAAQVAQKILRLFDTPFQIEEHELNISASI